MFGHACIVRYRRRRATLALIKRGRNKNPAEIVMYSCLHMQLPPERVEYVGRDDAVTKRRSRNAVLTAH